VNSSIRLDYSLKEIGNPLVAAFFSPERTKRRFSLDKGKRGGRPGSRLAWGVCELGSTSTISTGIPE